MENSERELKKDRLISEVISLQKGKIPPQSIDMEEAVLGAMMIDKKGIDDVIDILDPAAFYLPQHREIFKVIKKLFESLQPIDLLTVSNELKKEGSLEFVGGDLYIIKLTQKIVSSAHIEFHSRIILQKYIQRELIKVSSDIIENSYEDSVDVFDLLDDAESKIFEISQGNTKKGSEKAKNLIKQAIRKIEEFSEKEGLSGIPSGFKELDSLTSGWQNSDLIIIAARPGMGKTAFALSMAKNMAINFEIPVAIFSLEMSSVQLITRLISSETGLTSEKLRKGNLESYEWEQLNVRVKNLENAPLYIDDTPQLSIFELRAKCRRMVSRFGIKLILIDYLQLMTSSSSNANKNTNREQEISNISRNLKALAKELSVPIIALSQLSRAVETRSGSKRPILSDLRESGAIEQDADIVSFIYRPEYYNILEWDDEQGTPSEGQAEFIVAKHRNGGLNNIRLSFTPHLAQFSDLNSSSISDMFSSKLNSSDDSNSKDEYNDDVPF